MSEDIGVDATFVKAVDRNYKIAGQARNDVGGRERNSGNDSRK